MKTSLLLLTLTFIAIVSCTKQGIEGRVQIRIDNQTSARLEDFTLEPVGSSSGHDRRLNYNDIDARSVTGYRSHSNFSNIFLYEFLMPGYGIVRMEMRCLVGMNDLPDGKYSIVIIEGTDFPEVYLERD
jgi:hypothetical protein